MILVLTDLMPYDCATRAAYQRPNNGMPHLMTDERTTARSDSSSNTRVRTSGHREQQNYHANEN